METPQDSGGADSPPTAASDEVPGRRYSPVLVFGAASFLAVMATIVVLVVVVSGSRTTIHGPASRAVSTIVPAQNALPAPAAPTPVVVSAAATPLAVPDPPIMPVPAAVTIDSGQSPRLSPLAPQPPPLNIPQLPSLNIPQLPPPPDFSRLLQQLPTLFPQLPDLQQLFQPPQP